jgi:dipeptidyl aminopeptidase/acylaminoacyl peptidase
MTVAPYGAWRSPITSQFVISSVVSVGTVIPSDDRLYWIEGRPEEGGRQVVVAYREGRAEDVLPPPFNARTRVHEYGGRNVVVDGGRVYFSNFVDQRIYVVDADDKTPRAVTSEGPRRYADTVVDHRRNRLLCVCEDHSRNGEARNYIAAVALEDGVVEALAEGHDFYSNPRVSPDGSELVFLTWDHPNMPWDGTRLWRADIRDDGSLANVERVAGGDTESIFQPEWSPTGELFFASDRSGWWNIYQQGDEGARCVREENVEYGRPQWAFGARTYAFLDAETIVCVKEHEGRDSLGRLDVASGEFEPIDTPYAQMSAPNVSAEKLYFVGSHPTQFAELVELDIATGERRILKRSSDKPLDSRYLSVPEPVSFPTTVGHAYGYFYAPKNPDFEAPPDERPPLLVTTHGGPTGATGIGYNARIQYYASRGWAVLDVNYRGSTGYGRAYRDLLKDQWGIADVEDCVAGIRYLASRDLIDADRVAIRGGSAGGFTTLAALTFTDAFAAGASHYGIGDLEALARDTHKFESRYLDGMIGPYPEAKEIYDARSPIHHIEQLSCPVIFFQGLEDKVVPPNQAEAMVEVLRAKGIPVAYVAFEGEQHGFRKAENIIRAIDGEYFFFARIFGFEPADALEPVRIENLPPA